jgi:hypothetical protein
MPVPFAILLLYLGLVQVLLLLHVRLLILL